MNRTLLEKKRVIFSVNLAENRAVSVNLEPEQVIEDVETYFTELSEKCIDRSVPAFHLLPSLLRKKLRNWR